MSKLLEVYSKQTSTFLIRSLIWVVVLLGTLVFFWEGQGRLFPLWSFWVLLIGVVGIILFVGGLLLTLKERKKLLPLTASLIMLIGLVSLISGKGMDYGIWPRFYFAKIYYDHKVKQVLTARTVQDAERLCGKNCRVNKDKNGTLMQIVFPLGTIGSFWGWQAFVYDPTGGVMQSAKAWQGDKSVPLKYRGNIYFGCSLLDASHLTGEWYFCWFWHS